MIKILPLKEKTVLNVKPRYILQTTLGYGEHCDDTFTTHRVEIVERKDKGWGGFGQMTFKEAEEFYTFFKDILGREKCDHITLNDAWELSSKENPTTFWYKDIMNKKEMKRFSKYYDKYCGYLFNPSVEHNWYGLVDVEILYLDKNGEIHNCEVE